MAEAVERKLTTSLCADVSGYSRADGGGRGGDALHLIGLVERHRGRLVGTAGDSLAVEFMSVVEAVQCAVEIQRELAGRNRSVPEARCMEFRIGINLGDVMVEAGDCTAKASTSRPAWRGSPSPAASASRGPSTIRSGAS